jgi:multicomponent Na+:H+ antiporter subunit G
VTTIFIVAALAVLLLAAWLGAAGFARLRAPLDRLHCVTFVNVAGGGALFVAALLSDGLSIRVCKILLMVIGALIAGAALSHATGRALVLRGSVPEADPEDA